MKVEVLIRLVGKVFTGELWSQEKRRKLSLCFQFVLCEKGTPAHYQTLDDFNQYSVPADLEFTRLFKTLDVSKHMTCSNQTISVYMHYQFKVFYSTGFYQYFIN